MSASADLTAMMPFAVASGVTIDTATKDEVVGRLPYHESRTTVGGVLHGGALMTLADSVGAVCAYLNLPRGASTTTTSSSTVFLGAARSDVKAIARPLHAGRRTIAIAAEVRDDEGRLVAQTTQSQAVLTED